MPKNETNGSIPIKKKLNGSISKSNGTESKLDQVLIHELNHIFEGENSLISFFPEMIKKVSDEDMEETMNELLQQNKKQYERLDKILSRYSFKYLKTEKCEVMESHIGECKSVMSKFHQGPALDASLIIQLQKILHHKIASYGSICEISDVLNLNRIADVLDRTLLECENADVNLTQLAEEINSDAYEEILTHMPN